MLRLFLLLQFCKGFSRHKSSRTFYFDIPSVSDVCKFFPAVARATLVKGGLKGSGEVHFLPDHKKEKRSLGCLVMAQQHVFPRSHFLNVLKDFGGNIS